MGQILHKRATTTHSTRAAIQQSTESISTLARRYHINPKTVVKWQQRTSVLDAKMGKKVIKSTVLTEFEEEMIVKVRVLTQLALDDLLAVLKDNLPHLSRSALHRCLKRHGVSRLEKEPDNLSTKKVFKKYDIGYFHVDTAEVRTQEGKAFLFVAIDRVSKFAVAKLYKDKSLQSSIAFLHYVMETVPYVIETILTDNGKEYTDMTTNRGKASGCHAFDRLCQKHSIEHRLTKIKHPWTNGQVERMNRTIKEATVKTYHYGGFQQLQDHLQAFLKAYNGAKRLRSLQHKTPLDFLMHIFLTNPIRFKKNPHHYYLGPNN